MTLVSVLFYINRYLPFIDGTIRLAQQFLPNPSLSTCKVLFSVYGWIIIFAFMVADSILILRTYAVWENNRNVAFSLFMLLTIFLVVGGYCEETFFSSISLTPSPSRSAFPGCFVTPSGNILWVAYILILVFDTAILILTMIKVIQRKTLNGSILFRTIYLDGIMFYVFLSVSSLINIIVLNNTQLIRLELFEFQHSQLP